MWYENMHVFSHSFFDPQALGFSKNGWVLLERPRGLNPIWDSQQFDFQLGDDVDPILRIEAAAGCRRT